MNLPLPNHHPLQLDALVERHETLRMIMEWIADRFADGPEIDDTIAWEDGEAHDEPRGPSTL